MTVIDELHKSDTRADLRTANCITAGGAPLVSKEGEREKEKWARRLQQST